MPLFVTHGGAVWRAVAFLVCFLLVATAIGRRILTWAGIGPNIDSSERGVIAAALGMGVLQFIPFTLGVAGVLHPVTLRIALAAVLLAALPDGIAVVREVVCQLRLPRGWATAWVLALLPAVAVWSLSALAPTLDPDGLIYHLTVPKRWLQLGSLAHLPTYPYSNGPMAGEMLYAIAMVWAGDAAAKLAHLAAGLLAAAALYLAGTRLRGPLLGAAAATLFLVGPFGVGKELGWAYVEGLTTFPMAAACLAFLLWLQGDNFRWLKLSVVLAGLSATFKLTSALFPVGLLALTMIFSFDRCRRREGARPMAGALASALGLLPWALAPVLPWMARAWTVTRNPFFPLFARWIPSRDLPPELAARFEDYNRYMLWGIRLADDWSLARRKLVVAAAAAVLCLVGVLFLRLLRPWTARATVAVLVMMTTVQLFAVGLYTRYWIASLSLLSLAILAVLRRVWSAPWGAPGLVALTAIGAVGIARAGLTQANSDFRGLLRTVAGLEDRREFLMRHIPNFPIYEAANRTLPSHSRILLSFWCAGFYIDRTTYCGEFVQSSLRFGTWAEFVEDLERLGVTHVIAPQVLVTGGPPPPDDRGTVSMIHRAKELELVGQLLTERGRLLVSASGNGLYALDASLPPKI